MVSYEDNSSAHPQIDPQLVARLSGEFSALVPHIREVAEDLTRLRSQHEFSAPAAAGVRARTGSAAACSPAAPGRGGRRVRYRIGVGGAAMLVALMVFVVGQSHSLGLLKEWQADAALGAMVLATAALRWGLANPERAHLALGAGLTLTCAALAKLFLFDLATLDGVFRVLAFIGVGLLLLAAGTRYARAFAESGQRGRVQA